MDPIAFWMGRFSRYTQIAKSGYAIAPLFQRWKGASKSLKTHLLQKIPNFGLLGKSLRSKCVQGSPELSSIDRRNKNFKIH